MFTITVEKRDGRLTQTSREILLEQVRGLEDGIHTIKSAPGKKGYTASRYRYYFGCVLPCILGQAARFYRITSPITGEERQPRNTTELHQCMKAIYNPVFLVVGGKTRVIAGTTTDLNDSEFINRFQEQIIADHAEAPYNVEFITLEEWAQLLKSGQWHGLRGGARTD